jgi:hypothetical protein
MASLRGLVRDSVTKNLDLALSLEIPLPGPSGSSSSSLSFSLGQGMIPLRIASPLPPISPPSRSDLEGIGNSDSLPTIMGQETLPNG